MFLINFAKRNLFDVQAHQQARLEGDDPLGWNGHFLAGLWIAPTPGGSLPDFEDPEVAQLNGLARFEALDDIHQGLLDHPLDIHLGDAGLLGNRNH